MAFPLFAPSDTGIAVINADGSNLVKLTNRYDGFPSWSPDGTRIAFQRVLSRPPDASIEHIYVVTVVSRDETQLTASGTNFYLTPTWSPDGTQIALRTRNAAGTPVIYAMNADGSALRPLYDAAWGNLPAWSPFGTVPSPEPPSPTPIRRR